MRFETHKTPFLYPNLIILLYGLEPNKGDLDELLSRIRLFSRIQFSQMKEI